MPEYSDRLYTQLAKVVALELNIEQSLEKLIPMVAEQPAIAKMFKAFYAMVKDQRQALETRQQTIAGDISLPNFHGAAVLDSEAVADSAYPASTALQALYILFNQAVINYSTLQPLSHRFRESWVIADHGTTAHLARQHTKNYAKAIQQITDQLHAVILWELDREGLACRCTCSSCGLGICVCAASSQKILRDAWLEAEPTVESEGLYVHPPRPESAADLAGLQSGDVIQSVDGQELNEYSVLQSIVRNKEPGAEIRLQVQRPTGAVQEIRCQISK